MKHKILSNERSIKVIIGRLCINRRSNISLNALECPRNLVLFSHDFNRVGNK